MTLIELIKEILGIYEFNPEKLGGKMRDPRWGAVRREFLKKNPVCALCGGTDKLEIHHLSPFHIKPELELDHSNLITLCESGKNGIVCHRAFGHLGNYQSVNNECKSDVVLWNQKIKNR